MIFTVLSSLETVHDTVQYRFCIFSLLYRPLRIRLTSESFTFLRTRKRERQTDRERKYTVNIQCSVQYSYHSVQNLLSSRLLSKNLKIKIYRTITLPVVLYGCETWSLTLREERRLRVFENRVLRKVFGGTR